MFIKAEDGKIYNADHIIMIESVKSRNKKGYVVRAIMTKNACPFEDLAAIIGYAPTHEQGQALVDRIGCAKAGLIDINKEPQETIIS